jgi:hypothetical protein
MDLLRRRGRPLVHQPQRVPEPPPLLELGHHPQPDLVADQHERNEKVFGSGQEALELGECLVLPAGRNPQREGVQDDRVPLLGGFQDFAKVPDLQGIPSAGPAVPVGLDTLPEVFVLSDDGRCNVEDAVSTEI